MNKGKTNKTTFLLVIESSKGRSKRNKKRYQKRNNEKMEEWWK